MQLIGFWSAPRPPAGRGNCAITNPRRHGLSIRLGSGPNDVALIPVNRTGTTALWRCPASKGGLPGDGIRR